MSIKIEISILSHIERKIKGSAIFTTLLVQKKFFNILKTVLLVDLSIKF